MVVAEPLLFWRRVPAPVVFKAVLIWFTMELKVASPTLERTASDFETLAVRRSPLMGCAKSSISTPLETVSFVTVRPLGVV